MGLARRLVGDDRFDLLFWDGADTTGTVHGADIDYGDGTRWSGPLPPVFTGREELAVAIACEGFHFASRLGSSFHLHADSGDARRVAGLMRWFRIPILARRWYEECRRLAIENLEAFVQGWIFDRSLATTGVSLQHSDDTGWHAAIRAVLKGATIPDSVLASTWKYLLQANSVRFGENTVRQVWRQLVESSPVLAVRLIRCANLKPVELRAALDEVTDGSSLDDIAWQAAKDMGSGDKAFPIKLCERAFGRTPLDEISQRNFALAHQRKSFSRLFVAIYLQSQI